MALEFAVAGKPVGWQRTGGRGAARYTQAKTRRYEELVARCARIAMREKEHNVFEKDVPVAVEIIAYFARPKAKAHLHEWFPLHITRADEDNIQKAIKDALKGVVYKDDKQIVDSHTCLRYCPAHHPQQPDMKPHVQVRVWPAGDRRNYADQRRRKDS